MRRHVIVIVVAAMLAAFVPACSGTPTEPKPPAPPGTCQNTAAENYGQAPPCKIKATEGWMDIVYRPQTECKRANTADPTMCDRSRFKPFFGGKSWGEKYAKSVELTLQPDGTLAGRILGPAGDLRFYVSEPWLCPEKTICSEEVLTAEGVTINGTLVVVPKGAREGTYRHVPYIYE